MKAKQYFYSTLGLSIALVFCFVSFNYYYDIHGVFGNRKSLIKVYANERSAKYLLAHEYIPNNYEAFIVGPSLAANLNPADTKEQLIYNASCLGLNATEMKKMSSKIVEAGKVHTAYVCVAPYIFMNSGMKTGMMHEKEVQGALGSTGLLKTYMLQFLREKELAPTKFPKDVIHANGFNNYNLEMKHSNPEEFIAEKLNEGDFEVSVDQQAVEDLRSMLQNMVVNDVKPIVYFSPVPKVLYERYYDEYQKFYNALDQALMTDISFIDFNEGEYEHFTSDYSNYIDHGHLSPKGAAFVINELVRYSNQPNIAVR